MNKDNNNINNKHKAKALNKSSDALKYYDNNSNNNNINNNANLFELKINSNNNKSNKIGNKLINRQGTLDTLDYFQQHNMKIIKPEKSNIANNNKKEKEKGIVNNIENNKENRKKNPSIEKNKDKNDKINNNNKFIFSNMKYNKANINNIKDIKDLLALKKIIFKNQRLPRLKLNLDKK